MGSRLRLCFIPTDKSSTSSSVENRVCTLIKYNRPSRPNFLAKLRTVRYAQECGDNGGDLTRDVDEGIRLRDFCIRQPEQIGS